MKEMQYPINISAPNLVNVCVDESFDGEISGKLYNCYQKEPVLFSNLVQLLRTMEKFFDEIQFPQSSTRSRSFYVSDTQESRKKPKVADRVDVVNHRGEKGTFIITVQFRQNSTWQGELFWIEKVEKQNFSSTLDLIKILDGDLMLAEIKAKTASGYVVGK